ncbi:gluconate 2-dehydrogenase subunit 3 family protein [Halostella sp. JP-L12]|uniref:gluconate 2-dehydrogenase subunit 3 family protein n=1 Tax=Halostella TaxID=1843185 RepID=UPI000EF7FDCC|nr:MULTISPECIES: gluconate 2-dehydrogenase subunit 3 family protein [Halostella]NHN49730.1 gluconate 2-dehydrogenase subunit 3 family protein [Halostella sp. JP-L12]
MELSRRDALAALASGGVVAGVGAAGLRRSLADAPDDGVDLTPGRERDLLVAVARVVYPSEVDGVREFVETYVAGRADDREGYRAAMREALAAVDDRAREWRDANFLALDAAERDAHLREMGVDAADPDPEGTDAERIRYYVVNELLYALYTSPTGGELVGIENPQGHPGGTESYQRGPR